MTAVEIDVVVLTWNDGHLLDRATASALRSKGVDVNVIVVDNGSEPPAGVLADPRVSLIRSAENLGVSRGRNLGVRSGSAPLICLLDSDAELHEDTLDILSRTVASSPDIGLAGPVFAGQAPEDSGGRAPTVMRKTARVLGRTASYEGIHRSDEGCWDVDFVIGACQVFRRAAFEEIGGIDERWFYGPEDADFCMRLRNARWRVLQCADARCDHPARRRNRHLLTRRGLNHSWSVVQFLWRHRRYRGVAR